MFKKFIPIVALALAALVMGVSQFANAQTTPPGQRANYLSVVTGATTTGAKTAVRSVNVDKTYQFTGSTTAGTGTAAITLEGSNIQNSWNTVGTSTLTLGTVTTSTSINSSDRFTWIRANITSIVGTGAAVGVTAGF